VSLSASDPDLSEPLELVVRFNPATLVVPLARLPVRDRGGRSALEAATVLGLSGKEDAVAGATGTSGGRPALAAAGTDSRHSMHSASASSAGR